MYSARAFPVLQMHIAMRLLLFLDTNEAIAGDGLINLFCQGSFVDRAVAIGPHSAHLYFFFSYSFFEQPIFISFSFFFNFNPSLFLWKAEQSNAAPPFRREQHWKLKQSKSARKITFTNAVQPLHYQMLNYRCFHSVN